MADEIKRTEKRDPTAEAIEKLADAMIARGPKSPLEMAGLSEDQIRALTTAPAGKRFRSIPGTSDTGATFDLVVVESRAKEHPNGRIVRFENYRHPDAIYAYVSQGGMCPDGLPMARSGTGAVQIKPGEDPPKHTLTIEFVKWRWEQFYQADLRTFIGKPLKPHHCANPADISKVDWTVSTVGISDAAAE